MAAISRMFGMLVAGAALALAPTPLQADAARPAPDVVPIAMLVDVTAGGQVLDARDIDRRFLPASVTKIMTAYLAFEMIDAGKLDPNTVITVQEEDFKAWHGVGSTMFLNDGEQVTVDQLLHGITTVSANDGCIVLAHGVAGTVAKWVAQMNRTALQLGMLDTHYGSPNGYPDEGRTYTSAHDLALLASALVTRHPQLYRRYFGKPGLSFNGIAQDNHDPITGVVPGADGIKTGFTREAGYNFVGSAERNGRRLVMVLAGVDTGSARKQAARDYIEWGFAAFKPRKLLDADVTVATAKVQGGSSRSVALRTAKPVFADVPLGKNPTITMAVRYRGPVIAPFAKGAAIATLRVSVAGFAPYDVPLVAGEEVSEANVFQRLLNGVLGLV